jgi:hypothetical protein
LVSSLLFRQLCPGGLRAIKNPLVRQILLPAAATTRNALGSSHGELSNHKQPFVLKCPEKNHRSKNPVRMATHKNGFPNGMV